MPVGATSRRAHSVAEPASAPNRIIEIGRIQHKAGADVAPVIAARLRERGLADARLVSEPTGGAPFVTGRVSDDGFDVGSMSWRWWGATSIVLGSIGAGVGGVFLALGAATDDRDLQSIAPVAVGLLVGGAVVLTAGILMRSIPPQDYGESTITAELDVRRGKESKPLKIVDHAVVGDPFPENNAAEFADGIANGIAAEAR
jgi:hypothetical protein